MTESTHEEKIANLRKDLTGFMFNGQYKDECIKELAEELKDIDSSFCKGLPATMKAEIKAGNAKEYKGNLLSRGWFCPVEWKYLSLLLGRVCNHISVCYCYMIGR